MMNLSQLSQEVTQLHAEIRAWPRIPIAFYFFTLCLRSQPRSTCWRMSWESASRLPLAT